MNRANPLNLLTTYTRNSAYVQAEFEALATLALHQLEVFLASELEVNFRHHDCPGSFRYDFRTKHPPTTAGRVSYRGFLSGRLSSPSDKLVVAAAIFMYQFGSRVLTCRDGDYVDLMLSVVNDQLFWQCDGWKPDEYGQFSDYEVFSPDSC